MPTIKNIGKQQRMVVDRYLMPGDSRYISPKRVDGFRGDPDFEIVDETPVASGEKSAVIGDQPEVTILKVYIVDDEPLQTKPEVDPIDQCWVEAELQIQPFPTKRKARAVVNPPAEDKPAKLKRGRKN